jgi:outer membrane protein OmpA-like peptidoglycan-associated protein
MRASWSSLAGVSLGLVLTACTASLSLNVATPDARADADASAKVGGDTPTAVAPRARIVRTGDKLAYENGEIAFETDSAVLKGDSTNDVLDQFATVLNKFPALKLRIEAHTDSRGSQEYNRKLSDDRALAIKTALVKRGVAGARLSSEGMGEDHPTRTEPPYCLNKSEATIPEKKREHCLRVWSFNRRAAFIIEDGGDALPPEGTAVSQPDAQPTTAVASSATTASGKRRPDWALRFFGGYTLMLPDGAFNGGHVGVAAHASQRFGTRKRGYIGGGPRLHYRGVFRKDDVSTRTIHEFGPEGNLLLGGGSDKVVGLFSLRLGLGMTALRGNDAMGSLHSTRFTGWVLGGLVVLGKLTPRWSLGGHAEAGITTYVLVAEFGLNVAWHFGRGRRDGI